MSDRACVVMYVHSSALKALSVKLSSPFKSADATTPVSPSSPDTRRQESFTVHLGLTAFLTCQLPLNLLLLGLVYMYAIRPQISHMSIVGLGYIFHT